MKEKEKSFEQGRTFVSVQITHEFFNDRKGVLRILSKRNGVIKLSYKDQKDQSQCLKYNEFKYLEQLFSFEKGDDLKKIFFFKKKRKRNIV